ncbi:MAG: carbon-nitrogen hydrolase family protein [Desulfobacterales bacterium]|nr:MAG: carbon-nitrogen hydrolase family protein [Desulfobacterales bacterium]
MDLARIAVVQEDCKLGDIGYNLERAAALITRAAEEGARLVLFPEMFLTGYLLSEELRTMAEDVSGASIRRLAQLAATHRIHVCTGFAERTPQSGGIFNSLVCLSERGEILSIYRKAHLYDEEKNFFIPGNQAVVADTAIGRVGFLICYDIEFPEWSRINALRDAQLILVASANMEPWSAYQDTYAQARAMENQLYVAIANRIGRDGNFLFCGSSIVVDPMGNILTKADRQHPALLTAEIDLQRVKDARTSSLKYLQDRRAELYGGLVKASRTDEE